MATFLDELDVVDEKGKFALSQETNNAMRAFEEAQKYSEQTESNPLGAYIESLKPQRDEEKIKRQKYLAGINSLGQGLTNVIDLVSQKKGAYTPVRRDDTTTNLMQALTSGEKQFQQDESRFESAKLGELIRNVNLEQKRADLEEGREYKAGQLDKDREFRTAERGTAAKTAQDLENLRSANTVKEIKERNKAAAERQATTQRAKENKPFYTVSESQGKGVSDKQIPLAQNEYDTVLDNIQQVDSLVESDRMIKLLKRGELSAEDKKILVTKYWDLFYALDKDGKVVSRGFDKDYSPKETEVITSNISSGGAY